MDTDTASNPDSCHLTKLVDEARALLEATAGVAGDTVSAARKRLAAAIRAAGMPHSRSRTRRSPAPRPPTRWCASIPGRRSASPWGWGRSSATCARAAAAGSATDAAMPSPASDLEAMARTSARIAQRVLALGENRLALLTVEMEEEVERLLAALLMAMVVAVCGLLAAMAATAAVVVLAGPMCG